MKLKNFKLLCFAFFTLAFAMGCGGDDDSSPQLRVTIEDQFVNLPSNVSVFFRVDDLSGGGLAGLTESDFNIYENGSLISSFEAVRKIQPNEQVFDYNIMLLPSTEPLRSSRSMML